MNADPTAVLQNSNVTYYYLPSPSTVCSLNRDSRDFDSFHPSAMRTIPTANSVPSGFVTILNQLYFLEHQISKFAEANPAMRNINRIKQQFADWGYSIEELLGQKYDETRTDCEANIAGATTENLIIIDVIKPLIRYRDSNGSIIVQRGVVIVEGINEPK